MRAKVKLGYRKTEVGVIPNEWQVKSLSEISDKIMVGIASSATHAYRSEGIPLLRNQNIKPGYLDDSDVLYIAPSYEEGFKNKRLLTNDILIARTGYPGTACIVPEKFSAAQSFTTLITRPTNSKVDSLYLCYYINSEFGQAFFEQTQIGGAQKNVNAASLKKMPVPLPTLAEQQEIASALSGVDELISSLDQLIIKKRDIQQAAMQQLLTGQRRLPGFSGARSRHTLRDLVSTPVTDGPHETPRFVENGIPFLSVNNIANNRIDFRDLRFISREDHRIYSKKCRPQRNDLLLGKAASVGKVALIETDIELNIWSPIALIRMSDAHDPRYFYYAFRSKEIGRQIEVLTNSSSQGNIGMGDIERLIFSVPDLAEQNAIATILSDMDTELAVLEARRNKARDIKQGMMQALLTGRIRLV